MNPSEPLKKEVSKDLEIEIVCRSSELAINDLQELILEIESLLRKHNCVATERETKTLIQYHKKLNSYRVSFENTGN